VTIDGALDSRARIPLSLGRLQMTIRASIVCHLQARPGQNHRGWQTYLAWDIRGIGHELSAADQPVDVASMASALRGAMRRADSVLSPVQVRSGCQSWLFGVR
jgi:hypothetical protein